MVKNGGYFCGCGCLSSGGITTTSMYAIWVDDISFLSSVEVVVIRMVIFQPLGLGGNSDRDAGNCDFRDSDNFWD